SALVSPLVRNGGPDRDIAPDDRRTAHVRDAERRAGIVSKYVDADWHGNMLANRRYRDGHRRDRDRGNIGYQKRSVEEVLYHDGMTAARLQGMCVVHFAFDNRLEIVGSAWTTG